MKITTIYLIEDDAFFAESFIKRLEKLGNFQIMHFLNVESALQSAIKIPPQLLFLDNILKGQNGVDSIPEWLELYPQTKIAVITNNKDVSVLRKAIKAGAAEFFLKDVLLTNNTEAFIAELKNQSRGAKSFWNQFFDR